jgi:hypothetical protein
MQNKIYWLQNYFILNNCSIIFYYCI